MIYTPEQRAAILRQRVDVRRRVEDIKEAKDAAGSY